MENKNINKGYYLARSQKEFHVHQNRDTRNYSRRGGGKSASRIDIPMISKNHPGLAVDNLQFLYVDLVQIAKMTFSVNKKIDAARANIYRCHVKLRHNAFYGNVSNKELFEQAKFEKEQERMGRTKSVRLTIPLLTLDHLKTFITHLKALINELKENVKIENVTRRISLSRQDISRTHMSLKFEANSGSLKPHLRGYDYKGAK